MNDILPSYGPADRSKINVCEPSNVRWWCDKLDVSEEELRSAVRAVGITADLVARYLDRPSVNELPIQTTPETGQGTLLTQR